ncbi:MAG: hypothetical protein F6K63_14300 [Moorea sp. SIO1G6]|uniref:hypothetical protein n=1 Tax=Moorena sp. SIO1G6 TaxID=2607840 RepID=UPI0013BF88C9|nr:hypothetical protein [Moorena sp. SIO1G6]NET65488.1 hypothetical protein [Moorena sp. SIO1G6]
MLNFSSIISQSSYLETSDSAQLSICATRTAISCQPSANQRSGVKKLGGAGMAA